jgi:DNA-binding transcriptional LysR family regulator
LAQVHDYDPGVVVEVRVGSSGDLMPQYERGELDAAIVRREPQDQGASWSWKNVGLVRPA